MPTHEGSILTAPGPSTRTLPSTNAATSELVVPKSIPIIRSLIRRHTPWAPRHPDLCRAVHRAIPFITRPVDSHHRPLRKPARPVPPGAPRVSSTSPALIDRESKGSPLHSIGRTSNRASKSSSDFRRSEEHTSELQSLRHL